MLVIVVAAVLIFFGWLATKRSHRIRVSAARRTWRRSKGPPPVHLPSREHVMTARRTKRDAARENQAGPEPTTRPPGK